MDFATAVSLIRNQPLTFLSSESPQALDGFFQGYVAADGSAWSIVRDLVNEIDGPSQADACTRAYLGTRDVIAAFRKVVDALTTLLDRHGATPPCPGVFADLSFIAPLRDAVRRGHPAMILGEPTVVQMHDYFQGFLCGLEAVDPTRAAIQMRRLEAFERWAQGWYEMPVARWHAIIRVNEGPCERGVARFLEIWSRFESEVPGDAL